MKYDIAALGEMLIDFVPIGKDGTGDLIFSRKAGGAPLNLLATISKFGGKTVFIGKVGKDIFGDFLHSILKKYNISDEGLIADPVHNTTLAFVQLDENGEREFSFYRNFGADIFLDKTEVNTEIIKNSSIFHFGSLSLVSEPSRTATEFAISVARDSGCIITYDPNYREPLWSDKTFAVNMMKAHLDKVDILKISKDELLMLNKMNDTDEAVKLVQSCGVKIVLVTDGAKGASAYMGNKCVKLPAVKADTIDTTGAGDIFFGTFLSEWIKKGSTLKNITIDEITKFLKKAIWVAGKSTESHGAIASIPDLKGWHK
ncbi:MAG: carbohydrate kinase [Firmicutes bacterium]|nr:carbohydrate kinase [Bacillota bacterium]